MQARTQSKQDLTGLDRDVIKYINFHVTSANYQGYRKNLIFLLDSPKISIFCIAYGTWYRIWEALNQFAWFNHQLLLPGKHTHLTNCSQFSIRVISIPNYPYRTLFFVIFPLQINYRKKKCQINVWLSKRCRPFFFYVLWITFSLRVARIEVS